MYQTDRNPSWFRDAKWLSGILLVASLAAAVMFFSFAQLTTRERALPLLERVLQLTLLPEGLEGETVAVRRGVAYEPGQPLPLLPGVAVAADPGELDGLTAAEARDRIAGILTERTIAEGAGGARALVTDPTLGAQLDRALQESVPTLVRAHIARRMLPSGLTDGSRVLRWQEQAGPLVTPIWQVDLEFDRNVVAPLSDFQLGELVVDRLAQLTLQEGLPAALAAVRNPNLLARLETAVDEDARADLHELYATLLVAREAEIASRLEQARAVMAEQDAPPQGLFGVVTAEELAARGPTEANRLVLERLAGRAYEQGSQAVLGIVTEAQQSARLASASRLIDGLTADAHARYRRLTWILGIVSGVLLAALAAFSAGWGRLANPGLALALAAAAGALLSTRLAAALEGVGAVAPPVSLRSEGAFGYLSGLVAYVSASLPDDALEVFVRNHLVVLAVGAGLILLALLFRLGRVLRPRRRSLL